MNVQSEWQRSGGQDRAALTDHASVHADYGYPQLPGELEGEIGLPGSCRAGDQQS
ncbi:MAG TPA: hypothetical protein VMV07_27810 [Streptosporangiaceae bacterium]|nr:hypothetical protein [Streptosporangiaceae bacterium]